ncbi:MAG: macro domain-containing protein [Thermoleophilia bacterium]
MAIEFIVGDLLAQPVDAVVNAANESLMHGGGIAAVIARAAGPRLDEQSRAIGHVPTGDAAVTTAGDLPQRAVIHAVGPVWRGGDAGEPRLLASCHGAVVARAAEHGLATVALPAISTGIFGYPLDRAAPVAVSAIAEALAATPAVTLVRFCFLDAAARRAYAGAAAALGVG